MQDRRIQDRRLQDRGEQDRRIQDRRRYVRIPESLEIVYEILSPEAVKECLTKDIGQGGVRFITHEFIPKDSCLKIKFNFPRAMFSFETLVRCMWTRQLHYSNEFEVGVEFVDLSLEIQKYLISHIKDYLEVRDK
jgi:hypothetical protein